MSETVSIHKQFGRFNLLRANKSWCLQLRLPDDAPARSIAETFNEDEEPDDSGPPSEIVEIIAEKLESYLISTKRDETRKVIEWCRENADRLDHIWAEARINSLKLQIGRLNQYLLSTEPQE
jgi:hypothetical protein